ncbi:glycosyltransferase family 39 protein [Sinorhizobium sp. 8-89]|uniref:glycosyltransferase family 39 protein n=1 Tax=Sinorhizobium sp. 7-81 TaxID=3049087 RepID=UPI0024C2D4CB|nr:glycosyltransferase family 39 protein [Sinorhizobium sp. 7-81]MDK1385958.1 glycosyltransferase family 39 protein [Sinorhizobium sp. 7-81]
MKREQQLRVQPGSAVTANDALAPVHARAQLVAAVVLSLAVSLLFFATTSHGIGILPDSVAYMRIGGARHFAPLYTWLLQFTALAQIELVAAAWWLNWFLYVVNTVLILRLLLLAQLTPTWSALGTALIVGHPVFVEFHSVAMTEPLFIALTLASVLVFLRAMQDNRVASVALVGAILGLAMLTRFAAAPLLPAFAILRLLAGGGGLTRRLVDCAVMTGACGAVFGSWLIASELTSGDSTGRSLELLGDTDLAYWIRTAGALSTMLLPSAAGPVIRLLFLAFASVVVVFITVNYALAWLRLSSTQRARPHALVPIVFSLFSILYLLFLILSVMIQYRLTLTGRFLLPLYVFLALAVMTPFGASRPDFARHRKLGIVLVGLAAVIGASNLVRTTVFTVATYESGQGYAHKIWSTSPVLASASKLPASAVIYSNAPDVIEFRLRRSAAYIPRRFNHLSGRDEASMPFAQQMDAMRRRLAEGDAYVVFIYGVDWRDYLVSENDLLNSVPLVEQETLADGRIYRSATRATEMQVLP